MKKIILQTALATVLVASLVSCSTDENSLLNKRLEAKGIANLRYVIIPDPGFRRYLQEEIPEAFYGDWMDTNSKEVKGLTVIKVSGKKISSLEGLKYFTALTHLSCADNQLKSLDVSQNPYLEFLDCARNQLTRLDVTKNFALTFLDCRGDISSNRLKQLDVSENPLLVALYCSDNQLTSLRVGKKHVLELLDCQYNQLTSLDVSGNTALSSLYCGSNKLTDLKLSGDTALAYLYCNANRLTSLDVSNNTALIELVFFDNNLINFDLRGLRSCGIIHVSPGVLPYDLRSLKNVNINEAIQHCDEMLALKNNLRDKLTISTYDDNNQLICADYDPRSAACLKPQKPAL